MKTSSTASPPVSVVLSALVFALVTPLDALAQDQVSATGWAVSGFAMVEPTPVAVLLQPTPTQRSTRCHLR